MEEERVYDQLEKDVNRIWKSSKITKVQFGESFDQLIELLSETKRSISAPVFMEEEHVIFSDLIFCNISHFLIVSMNKDSNKGKIERLHEKLTVNKLSFVFLLIV